MFATVHLFIVLHILPNNKHIHEEHVLKILKHSGLWNAKGVVIIERWFRLVPTHWNRIVQQKLLASYSFWQLLHLMRGDFQIFHAYNNNHLAWAWSVICNMNESNFNLSLKFYYLFKTSSWSTYRKISFINM